MLYIVGVDCGEGPPVPIPNTAVKLTCADNTWLETAREDKASPTSYKSSKYLYLLLCYVSIGINLKVMASAGIEVVFFKYAYNFFYSIKIRIVFILNDTLYFGYNLYASCIGDLRCIDFEIFQTVVYKIGHITFQQFQLYVHIDHLYNKYKVPNGTISVML